MIGELVDPQRAMMALWAKERSATEDGYHPLVYHLIDAAVVTEVMWQHVIPSAVRQRFARSMGLDESSAGRWAAFLVGCHDLGKACICFAYQVETARARLRE
jgi:hypothetical protein